MNTFGYIKTKTESLLAETYGKNSFKENIRQFKDKILDNKNIATAYYLYDRLSKKSGLSNNIVDDYVNESIEKLRTIFDKEKKAIDDLRMWVNENYKKDTPNNYEDIDVVVYEKSFKKLEKILESKNRIKDIIRQNEELKTSQIVGLPLSTIIKLSTNTFNQKYSHITKEEKRELKELLMMTKTKINEDFNNLKDELLLTLGKTLNESTDDELKDKLTQTINKINESEPNLISLYKLKQLKQGL